MTGNLNLGGHEIINLAHVPTTDNFAVTKKWVTDEFPTKREVLNGFTLSGPLHMSGCEIYGLPDVPNTDNSAASTKYVNDGFSTASGLTQAQADNRYVRKTKIALGEMDGHVRRHKFRRLQLFTARQKERDQQRHQHRD